MELRALTNNLVQQKYKGKEQILQNFNMHDFHASFKQPLLRKMKTFIQNETTTKDQLK